MDLPVKNSDSKILRWKRMYLSKQNTLWLALVVSILSLFFLQSRSIFEGIARSAKTGGFIHHQLEILWDSIPPPPREMPYLPILIKSPRSGTGSLRRMLWGTSTRAKADLVKYTQILPSQNVENWKDREVVWGMISYDEAMQFPGPKRLFTTLRDPIERSLSYYEFVHRGLDIPGVDRELSVREFFTSTHPVIQAYVNNSMTWQLGASLIPEERVAFSNSEALSRAKCHVLSLDSIVFFEDFADGMEQVRQEIFPMVSGSWLVRHIFQLGFLLRPLVWGVNRRGALISAEDLKYVRQMNTLDQELYEFAWQSWKGAGPRPLCLGGVVPQPSCIENGGCLPSTVTQKHREHILRMELWGFIGILFLGFFWAVGGGHVFKCLLHATFWPISMAVTTVTLLAFKDALEDFVLGTSTFATQNAATAERRLGAALWLQVPAALVLGSGAGIFLAVRRIRLSSAAACAGIVSGIIAVLLNSVLAFWGTTHLMLAIQSSMIMLSAAILKLFSTRCHGIRRECLVLAVLPLAVGACRKDHIGSSPGLPIVLSFIVALGTALRLHVQRKGAVTTGIRYQSVCSVLCGEAFGALLGVAFVVASFVCVGKTDVLAPLKLLVSEPEISFHMTVFAMVAAAAWTFLIWVNRRWGLEGCAAALGSATVAHAALMYLAGSIDVSLMYIVGSIGAATAASLSLLKDWREENEEKEALLKPARGDLI